MTVWEEYSLLANLKLQETLGAGVPKCSQRRYLAPLWHGFVNWTEKTLLKYSRGCRSFPSLKQAEAPNSLKFNLARGHHHDVRLHNHHPGDLLCKAISATIPGP